MVVSYLVMDVIMLTFFCGFGVAKTGVHMGTKRGALDGREGTSNVCLEFEDGRLGYHFGTWGARVQNLDILFMPIATAVFLKPTSLEKHPS